MIPAILEILACLIAIVSGFFGLWFGIAGCNSTSIYLASISGVLSFVVFAYLSNISELLQKASKPTRTKLLICQVLHKSIYVIFAAQLTLAVLMVK